MLAGVALQWIRKLRNRGSAGSYVRARGQAAVRVKEMRANEAVFDLGSACLYACVEIP